MEQTSKEILMKDLCARLPYGVKGLHRGEKQELLVMDSFGSYQVNEYDAWFDLNSVIFKPYLFPFSSITKEQKRELNKKFNVQFSGNDIHSIHYHSEGCWDTDLELDLQDWLWFINWCYKNHFDVNNLIEKGLAVDATGLNIYC